MGFKQRLQGKFILLTNANSDIGQTTAQLFAQHGATLILQDDSNVPESFMSGLDGTGHQSVSVEPNSEQAWVELFASQATLDAVVNIGDWTESVDDNSIQGQEATSDETERAGEEPEPEIFDVDSMHDKVSNPMHRAMFICRESMKAMLRIGKGGSIITTCSVTKASRFESSEAAALAGALETQTKSLSKTKGKKGIRVNGVVCSSYSQAERDSNTSTDATVMAPIGRRAKPLDLANAYLFLASDDSAFVNGQILKLDGGASL